MKLEEISDFIRRFLNCKTAIKVNQELTIQFERLGLYNTDFAQQVTHVFYVEDFLWHDIHTSRNVFIFIVFDIGPLYSEQ